MLPIEPLERISPSLFPVFKKCKLKAIWTSSRIPALLPVPPSARLGTVIHKILEKAGKGEIKSGESFNLAWIDYVRQEETKMNSFWTEKHLVPFKKSAHDYEVKKQQCLLIVQHMASVTPFQRVKCRQFKREMREVWLQTPDGSVGGYADAIMSTEVGGVILDYKTGSFMEPGQEASEPAVHGNIQIQLKLYAALYNSMYDRWPASIKIVGINGESHEIQFDAEECASLLDEARQILTAINLLIKNEAERYEVALNRLASPSPEICQFCRYRPCCFPYWEKREVEQEAKWPHDAKGIFKEKKILGNGLMLIKLTDLQKSNTITVRGLHPDRHPALNHSSSDVLIFSIINDKVPGSYREGLFTTIYAVS